MGYSQQAVRKVSPLTMLPEVHLFTYCCSILNSNLFAIKMPKDYENWTLDQMRRRQAKSGGRKKELVARFVP